jgi:hypothetical protein
MPRAAIHRTAWGDIGMCTRPQSRRGMEALGVRMLPATEGVRHFVAAVERAAESTEVLVTDRDGIHAGHPLMRDVG